MKARTALLGSAVLAAACAFSAPARAWDTRSPTDETNSTHLWIVDHAIDLLAQRADLPGTTAFVQAVNAPACRASWQQGLFDADYLAVYNNGDFNSTPSYSTAEIVATGATWKSHFFDPATDQNYEGETNPTGRTQAALFLATATSSWSTSPASACYHLGLSFHYMTDTTQPMHAANFTADDRAVELHTNFELYAMGIQQNYVVTDASFLAASQTPDAALVASAEASKALWPGLLQSFYAAYLSNGLECRADYDTWLVDRPACWEGNTALDAVAGVALETAQRSTAAYLYALATSFNWQ